MRLNVRNVRGIKVARRCENRSEDFKFCSGTATGAAALQQQIPPEIA